MAINRLWLVVFYTLSVCSARADSLDATPEEIETAAAQGDHAQLARWLLTGQPDAVTDLALERLASLKRPESLEVLSQFTRHRRATVRLRAYTGVSQLRSKEAAAVVAHGLRDASPRVRGACALALARMEATQALPWLVVALSQGVPQAATGIGKLGTAQHVERLHAELGRAPLSALLAGYREFLKRADLELAVKRAIVGRLVEVAGPSVEAFFREQLRTLAFEKDSKLRGDLQRAVRQVSGAGA